MLRYDRQTKPGLVALYDIRPGNGAGPFLQPQSPHGAWHFTINHTQTRVMQSTDHVALPICRLTRPKSLKKTKKESCWLLLTSKALSAYEKTLYQ